MSIDSIIWNDEPEDYDDRCVWTQMRRRPLRYDRCHDLASVDTIIGGLCMKHFRLYQNLERQRKISDEGYDPWGDADDDTQPMRNPRERRDGRLFMWHGAPMENPIPRLESLAKLGYPEAIEALARMRVIHGRAASPVEEEHAWLVVEHIEDMIDGEMGYYMP